MTDITELGVYLLLAKNTLYREGRKGEKEISYSRPLPLAINKLNYVKHMNYYSLLC